MPNLKERIRGLWHRADTPADPAHATLTGEDSFADDSNEFALAMYSQLRRRPGNLFFSPLSIRTALGMACAGARNETSAQMRHVLRFPPDGDQIHQAVGKFVQRLSAAGNGASGITVANSLWAHDRSLPVPAFLNLIKRCYFEDVPAVDFAAAAEAARVRINEWTANRTRNRIVELIPDPLHPDTRLLLVSAVYFKGGWENEFEINGTRDEPFYADGGTSQVPLMRDQQGLRHMRASGYQAVELNYRDSYLSMLVLLPDRRDGLKELEDALTVSLLNQTTRQMELTPVKLSLPRFKFSWGTVDLCSDLDSLGMREAFDRSRADFSGINGHVPPSQDALFIAHVLHQAFVDVNETGTEAAAATAVGMAPRLARSPRPIAVFRADHPFLFALRDRSTDMILFLGRVADPAQT